MPNWARTVASSNFVSPLKFLTQLYANWTITTTNLKPPSTWKEGDHLSSSVESKSYVLQWPWMACVTTAKVTSYDTQKVPHERDSLICPSLSTRWETLGTSTRNRSISYGAWQIRQQVVSVRVLCHAKRLHPLKLLMNKLFWNNLKPKLKTSPINPLIVFFWQWIVC